MGKPKTHLSGLISLFVEKDEKMASKKRESPNKPLFSPNQLAESFGNLMRPNGCLGY